MIHELAKKDSYWRKVAYNICKDKMLSDDLVSEMYLRLADCKKEINDFYVIVTIKNIFLQHIKTKKTVSIDNFYNLASQEVYELDDKEQTVIDEMYWVAKAYIEMNQTMSLRQIAKELNTDYSYIFRVIKNEKLKWQDQRKAKD